MYTYIYAYIHIRVYIYTHVYEFTHTHTYIHTGSSHARSLREFSRFFAFGFEFRKFIGHSLFHFACFLLLLLLRDSGFRFRLDV